MPRPYDKDVVLDDKGTLWVTTDDVKKVYRVIVVDDVSHWCLTFYTYPTEEPVRRGRWIKDDTGAEYCSNCHEYPYDDGEYHIANWHSNYCPNCGAKMDEHIDTPTDPVAK